MMDSLKNCMNAFEMKSKTLFLASIHRAFLNQELSSSQKQTVFKMLGKKIKTKDSLKTGGWYHCLIQIISKVLLTKIKNGSSFLISSNQTAYVKSRFISESGRVISDFWEISNSLALEGVLVTVDIEKAFDSVNHCFLL